MSLPTTIRASRRLWLLSAIALGSLAPQGCDSASDPESSGETDTDIADPTTAGTDEPGSSGDTPDPSESTTGDSSIGSDSDSGGSSGGREQGCEPFATTLSEGQTVTLTSAGPGSVTGVFCILVPQDATMIAFQLEGGVCEFEPCSSADIVQLYFREDELPDHTNPDEETHYWEHEVGGFGEFGASVAPGPAYLVTNDGAHSLGYQDVSLRVGFDTEGDTTGTTGGNECERVPDLDEFACPPGFPPAAYDCFDASPPASCVPGAGPEYCCPA